MRANVMPGPRTDELNGLNWQVQVDPLTLSMTSLPPIVALDAEFELFAALAELDELPPQAVRSMPTPADAMRHLTRSIDTLHSVSTIATRSLAPNVCFLHPSSC